MLVHGYVLVGWTDALVLQIPVGDKEVFGHFINILDKHPNRTLLVDKAPVTFTHTLETQGFKVKKLSHFSV